MISQRESGELARFYTVTDPKKHRKGYTVYKVTARIISRKTPEDIQEITVWKRYSDFRKLHQNLWLLHKNVCCQSELFPPFAKAKLFGRFDDSVVEERRQCSEDLLQFSANIPALYNSQHIQDFFKGGEVHDGSELIGPVEPFSDFLADRLSDCSSDGPSSDSDLTSLAVDTDSLVGLDDGMASGHTSPNQPHGGATNISSSFSPRLPSFHERHTPSSAPVPASSAHLSEVSRPDLKSDYLEKASELICLAVEKEKHQDYQAAFSYYRSGVDLLLQGVQGQRESSSERREAVKKKTAEYLMRAEQISSHFLKSSMGQGSTQTVCCSSSRGGQQSPSDELTAYRVLGVIDKVLLVMDKRTQETLILKGLRKSSDCGRPRKTIMPHSVPHMVKLRKFIICEDTIFLLLQYAEGGKLWSHITKYLHKSSPDDSFDIPFIQKSHTAAVHSPQHTIPRLEVDSGSPDPGPAAGSDCHQSQQEEGQRPFGSPLKSSLPPGVAEPTWARSDSGATSEEECTNSYLTLCNEYEQDKVEPDQCRNEENEQSEVFSPLRSPVAPLSLDQSKHTPMEFFRIDSKDSASEVTCLDSAAPHKQTPPFSTCDLGSDITENLPELAQGVSGPALEFWGLDCSDKGSNESVPVISFKEAAVEEEACPPDLLVNLPAVGGKQDSAQEELKTSGVCLGLEVTASPQKCIQPDVLQLHSQPEDRDDQQKPFLFCVDSAVAGSSVLSPPLESLLDDGLVHSQEAPEKVLDPPIGQTGDLHVDSFTPDAANQKLEPCTTLNTDVDPNRSGPNSPPAMDGAHACAPFENLLGLDGERLELLSKADGSAHEKDVSRLFAQLDELSLAASQVHIPEEFVRSWAAELVMALSSLHQEGIICKDLNPNNILLDHQGHVQLTYFCSWYDVEESCDKEAVASMFCAPEVGGISEETESCDWWSLGAVLFELLTGVSLLRCHPAGIGRHTALNIPESVSEEARSLLEQLLQYNPTERLGAGVGGVDDIKSHPFFASVEWPE
uniref:Ribosomal protein S6 kinase polypeptide 1 n=1 Tax=Oryzias sinensis TaxID=183150 RepID=A0A8C8DQ62_9TELE